MPGQTKYQDFWKFWRGCPCLKEMELRWVLGVDTVPFRSIRKPCDIFTKKELRKKSDKLRKNYCRGFRKSGVTRDIRIDRNGTVALPAIIFINSKELTTQ